MHKGGEQPLIGEAVDTFFRKIVRAYPDEEAVVSRHQGHRWTYKELDQHVDALAKGLLAMGLTKGDCVGIWSTNNVEWLTLQMATARMGAILVNINPAYKAEECKHALKQVDVKALFLIPSFRSSQYADMILSLCPELHEQTPGLLASETLPALKWVVTYDPITPEQTERFAKGVSLLSEILSMGEQVDEETLAEAGQALQFDDPINIQFTSGTTGLPKAVLLTHHGLLNNAYFVGKTMKFGPKEKLCISVPFYHCFGMVISNLLCLLSGATLVIPAEHFDPIATLQTIEEEQCTAAHGVPTMFIAMLEQYDKHPRPLPSLRTGIMAGAPCPPDVMTRVIEDLGCKEILIAYGQTEASPVTHLTHPDDSFERRVGTVGVNLPHQEVKIIDPVTKRLMPIHEQGEICFRGYHVMREYVGMPEATNKTIDDAGWLHSGDLGVMDEEGYVKVTGRLKDMIIRGGENVYPAEIEACYHKHPAISDIAVFGIPDKRLGEEVGAWVKCVEGESMTEEAFRAFGKEHMAHFKIPRYIEFVETFPMTVTGKIQKFKIRDIVVEKRKAQP
tara:strand:- start:10539 stop:12221 length:1683 start_codon:yes stop_codon:yes gene_type:complete